MREVDTSLVETGDLAVLSDQSEHRVEARRRYGGDTAHFLNQPHQGVDLHGPLALEVLQHRCLVRANLARAVDAPFDIESGS